jgi:cobalt-precorrin 5A hydrolase
MKSVNQKVGYAVWALTPNGLGLAGAIAANIAAVDVYLSRSLEPETAADPLAGARFFSSLSDSLTAVFHRYRGHILIASTGIAVRIIAPLLRGKTVDPAVVVVDDRGNHAISLLSGHIGGANSLTSTVARIIGAEAVITTATDVNRQPAIDVLAVERDLCIENPAAIKGVNMAILRNQRLDFHDPYRLISNALDHERLNFVDPPGMAGAIAEWTGSVGRAGVFIDDIRVDLPAEVLILRPATLIAGIGCNRNTATEEIQWLLNQVLDNHGLSPNSLSAIATASLKKDESGLLKAAEAYGLPIRFYEKTELNRVDQIKNPSAMAEKHIGVKSVCEAAAILAAAGGKLIVAKQKTANVTVAIARIAFTS